MSPGPSGTRGCNTETSGDNGNPNGAAALGGGASSAAPSAVDPTLAGVPGAESSGVIVPPVAGDSGVAMPDANIPSTASWFASSSSPIIGASISGSAIIDPSSAAPNAVVPAIAGVSGAAGSGRVAPTISSVVGTCAPAIAGASGTASSGAAMPDAAGASGGGAPTTTSASGSATAEPASSVAASAGLIHRIWMGTGRLPYLLGVYLAMHGFLPQTCKRVLMPLTKAHPVTPFSFFFGFDGAHSQEALMMASSSSCPLNSPA